MTTYAGGSAALECAVVDLHGALRNINSAALEVACPPPELERKCEIVLLAENAWMELKSSTSKSANARSYRLRQNLR